MEKKKFRLPIGSLRFRIIIIVAVAIFGLLLVLLFNNIYAIRVVRNQVYESSQKTLSLYMSQIDDSFRDVENYWVGLQQSENMVLIENPRKESDFHTAQARLKKDMEAVLPTYSMMDNLFVYFGEADSYIDAARYELAGAERSRIRNMLIQEVKDGKARQEQSGKWLCLEAGGEYYLTRILRNRQAYMGGCVKVTSLIERLRKSGYGKMDYLAICENSGRELGHELPALNQEIRLGENSDYYTLVGKQNKYMLFSAQSACGEYSLVAMIRDTSILEGLASFQLLIPVLFICLSALVLGLVIVVRRWVLKPINYLISGMKSLTGGNLDVRLTAVPACDEFATVNTAFDEMTQQIRTLKIDVYEQKMQRQKAELQYMKLQINPHFYINCLNVIHNLSIMKKNDLIQEMAEYLGNHLRYTMEGNSLDRLEKEINYVKNYMRIQELRFIDSVICHYIIEEPAYQALVPPLVIQTFIENTVKYQVSPSELTEIFVEVTCLDQLGEAFLCIEIWDTGEGFSEHIQKCLNEDVRIFDEQGEHFGIYNVRQRLHLLYNGREEICFLNHEITGGAYVRMILPYVVYQEGDKG